MRFAATIVSGSLCLLVAGGFSACSKSGDGGTGSGGASASGGAPGTGGAAGKSGTGGMGETGGVPSTGGAQSSGGAVSSGGVEGTGGNVGAGGTSAKGGALGSGGVSSGGAIGTGGRAGAGGGSGGIAASGGSTGPGTGGMSSGGAGATGTGGSASGGGTGTTPTVDCTDTSTTTLSFTKQYEDGEIAVDGSTKTYHTMTNWWHKFGGQTVSLNGLSMKVGNSQNANVPASDGNPMGFPSIFIGAYQKANTVGSNLPKKVSDIKSVPTVFNTNWKSANIDTSNLNLTYDVWFTASSSPLTGAMANNPGKGGAYLMVWLYKPSDRQPRGGTGSTTGSVPNHLATTVDGVSGKWDVWVDPSDPLCISYVASEPIEGISYDLNKFIQDSVTKQYGITSSMYLSIIFAGTEIWSGGDGLEVKQFCAAVN
jgi:hypothetical protein